MYTRAVFMTDFEINQKESFQLLWLVVVVVALMVYASYWKVRARRRFASKEMISKLLGDSSLWQRLAVTGLPLLGLLFLVLALADLRWGEVQREMPQKGIEVMFLLDVSKSMLAEDVKPNRLTRAKQMILDTIDEMAGDRVGLTLFAGEAKQRIPMTNHYEDFKLLLNEVSPDDLGIGGSRLGDAIRVAAASFLSERNDHQVIVILTDGEDQESEPVKYAKEAYEDRGIRIHSIGLGDVRQGGRVPSVENGVEGYLQFQGEQVWSKLDGKVLADVARVTKGEYIPAGTRLVDMADFYYGFLASIKQAEFETATFSRLEARYQWFLAPAILALLAECWYRLFTAKRLA